MILLPSKLMAPPARAALVSRPRLLARLEEALAHPLTLLVAPAGSGKTTLLAQGLAAWGGRHAWLTIDEEDEDPARFLAYLCAAFERLRPGCATAALARIAGAGPPRAIVEALLGGYAERDADGSRGPALLAIDDYQLITSAPLHDAVAFLVEHLPPDLRLAIASRTTPPLPLPRWRVRRLAAEIGAGELRFSEAEAEAFLSDTMGLALSRGEAAALTARTEGWAAGLQHAALALAELGKVDASDPAARRARIAAFGGGERRLADYLRAEVLDRQPPDVRSFLLRTAILERLCPALCEAVLQQPARPQAAHQRHTSAADHRPPSAIYRPSSLVHRPPTIAYRSSAEASPWSIAQRQPPAAPTVTLEALARADLFLTPLEGGWYRCHPLFREFLLLELERRAGDAIPALHRRAAAWYEAHGLIEDAAQHALQCGDERESARLIAAAAPGMIRRGELPRLRQWLAGLPEPLIRARPELCLSRIWTLLDLNQPAALGYLEPVRLAAGAGQEELLTEALALCALAAAMAGDAQRARELAQEAQRRHDASDQPTRALIALGLGAAHLVSGRGESAAECLRAAALAASAAPGEHLASSAYANLGDLQLDLGRLAEAERSCRQALALLTASGAARPASGWIYWTLGRIHYEWNDVEQAREEASRAVALCAEWGNNALLVRSRVLRSQIAQADGDAQGAWALLDAADQAAQQSGDPRLGRLVTWRRVLQALAAHDLADAQGWAETLGRAGDQAPPSPYEGYVLARLALAEGHPRRALERLAGVRREFERMGWARAGIQALVVEALAERAQGRRDRALAALEHALRQAAPGGFVRTFVEEGAPMQELLRAAAAHSAVPAYIGRLLAAFGAPTPAAPPGARLTGREQQIVRLLAAGLSNHEMAAQLVIAEGTLKRHLSNLYLKLGVHSRTQALARAAELKLLGE